jgi:transglutaminase-like putative cysteine protease
MRFNLGCTLGYTTGADTPFVFNIEVQTYESQIVLSEHLQLEPALPTQTWTMPESGNRYFRVIAPPGRLIVRYEAEVDLTPRLEAPESVGEISPATLPLDVFTHLYPSRYCQSDKLERFARSTFGSFAPGYARVNAICNWINDYVAYEGGVSDALTSAFDTVTQRAGVCRDFSHLAIALCRTLGIPARYVSAYASQLQPPDFHAVFEAFLGGPEGGAWYIFDATRLADPAGLVRIGVGRDAAEVAFCSPYAPAQYDKPEVWITSVGPPGLATVQAVRTSAI